MSEKTEKKVYLNEEGKPVNEGNPDAVETITETEARERNLKGYESWRGAGRPKEKK
jgi:hypothetical protein